MIKQLFHATASDNFEKKDWEAYGETLEIALQNLACAVIGGDLSEGETVRGVLQKWAFEREITTSIRFRHWQVLSFDVEIAEDPRIPRLVKLCLDITHPILEEASQSWDEWEISQTERELYGLACEIKGENPNMQQFLVNLPENDPDYDPPLDDEGDQPRPNRPMTEQELKTLFKSYDEQEIRKRFLTDLGIIDPE